MHGFRTNEPTAAERIRAARLKRQRQRAEADRVTRIIAEREERDIRNMMRDNRAGGF